LKAGSSSSSLFVNETTAKQNNFFNTQMKAESYSEPDPTHRVSTFDAEYRLSQRQRIQFQHYNVGNPARGEDSSQRAGDVKGDPEAAASNISSSVTELGYSFSFLQTNVFEVSGIAGVHYLDNQLFLSKDYNNTSSTNPLLSTGLSPLLGVNVEYQVTKNLHAASRAQVSTFEGERYAGSMYDLRLTVGYSLLKNFDFAVDYNVVEYDLGAERNNFNENYDLKYNGYRAYGVFRF